MWVDALGRTFDTAAAAKAASPNRPVLHIKPAIRCAAAAAGRCFI